MLEDLLTVPTSRRVKSGGCSQLKTRQLALLVSLDEERTLARAAAATDLTQPAASKLLSQVEKLLDVKLFERSARGMAPTCYGEILVRHARTALSGLGLAREEITALKSGLTGRATIGTGLTPGTHIVPTAIARVKQRYPRLLLGIEIDPSRQLVQRLLQGQLDIVVGRVLEAGCADELVYEPLATDEPHAIIAGAEHPLARRQGLDLEDLIDQPWILPPEGNLVRERLFSTCIQRGLAPPTNIVETLSLPAITSLLQQSNYVVALPEQAVQPCCKAGILKVLVRNLPLGIGGFGLVTRRHHKLSPGAQLLFNTVREVGKELNPREKRFLAHLKTQQKEG
jgi:DNA-binding transcriptional LysR family regulator